MNIVNFREELETLQEDNLIYSYNVLYMRLLSSLLNNLKFRNFFVAVTTHNVINTLKGHKLKGLKLNVPSLKIMQFMLILGRDSLSKGLEPTGIEPPAGARNRKTLPPYFQYS